MIKIIVEQGLQMKEDLYSNPFSGINAATLDNSSILKFWCSPFSYFQFASIKEEDIFNDPNNIILMGGRSTGKTMFLRYWSFPVQLEKAVHVKSLNSKSILDQIKHAGGLGFYIRIDGPVLRSFQGHGVKSEEWNAIFIHYLEIIIAKSYFECLQALELEKELYELVLNTSFYKSIGELIGNNNVSSIQGILDTLNTAIEEVNNFRGTIPFYDKGFTPKKGFASQSLIFGLPTIFNKYLNKVNHRIRFIVFIDEYENYLEEQQRVINTLLKFTNDFIKFRIGMRLEGFRTTATISKDDFIKEGREYRKVVIEEILIRNKGYIQLLKEICKKRLETIPSFKNQGKTDIEQFLSSSEYFEKEAKDIVGKNRKRISEYFSSRISNSAIDIIGIPENPLLQILSYIWIIRGISPKETKKSMDGFIQRDFHIKMVNKYKMDYIDKYKLSLMFILCSIYRKRKQYYSFNTFAFLSSGIIGSFLELCRRTFQYAEFEDKEGLIKNGLITNDHQTKAALDVAESELQQLIRIEEYGSKIYRLIVNIGNIFRYFHIDEKLRYPETNQFSIDPNMIETPIYREAFLCSIKWSAIQRKPHFQQSSPGHPRKDIFMLNRLFSPNFQISYRIRGGYSVDLMSKDIKILMSNDEINPQDFMPKSHGSSKSDQLKLDL